MLADNSRDEGARLASVHLAIAVIDAVIAEGEGPPEGPGSDIPHLTPAVSAGFPIEAVRIVATVPLRVV
jgi:hypothetical protein